MTLPLTYVELFAGAGGLSLGLDRAGWECLGHAEVDDHARSVLRYGWPNTPLHGDVSTLDGTQWKGVTMLSGGSPCQDLSIAGKREGLTGRRSGLFYHQVRLWHECEAPLLLWENVVGALSSQSGKDFARILSTLLGEPLAVPRDGKRTRLAWGKAGAVQGTRGVTVAWRVLDLRRFGIPQRRRRVFVVASRTSAVDPRDVLLDLTGLFRNPEASRQTGQADPRAAAVVAPVGGAIPIGEATARQGKSMEGSAMIGDAGDPMFTLTSKQHAVLDSAVSFAELRLSDETQALTDGGGKPGQGYPAVLQDGAIPIDLRNATRTTDASAQNRQGSGIGNAGDPSPTLTGAFTPAVFDGRATGGDAIAMNPKVGNADHIVSSLRTMTGPDARDIVFQANAVNISGGAVQLDPVMGTLGHRSGGSEIGNQNGTGRGTPIVADQGPVGFRMVAFGEYDQDGSASAIKSRDHKDATDLVIHGAFPRPRRLMPIECERLMDWPDNHTAIGIDERGKQYHLKDTPRYKLCGNGVGSICAEWIGRRIAHTLSR